MLLQSHGRLKKRHGNAIISHSLNTYQRNAVTFHGMLITHHFRARFLRAHYRDIAVRERSIASRCRVRSFQVTLNGYVKDGIKKISEE